MSARQDIVDALDAAAIDGAQPQLFPPDQLMPGLAWPVWERSVPTNFCVMDHTYAVYVTLPSVQTADSIDAADPLVVDVSQALMKVGQVTGITPVKLTAAENGPSVNALRFETHIT